jgi:hypothetical protein
MGNSMGSLSGPQDSWDMHPKADGSGRRHHEVSTADPTHRGSSKRIAIDESVTDATPDEPSARF